MGSEQMRQTQIAGEKDLIVIGAGPAGYNLAAEAAGRGLDVLLIEKKNLGGTCLNRGCIPTKAYLALSALYRRSLEAERMGLELSGVHLNVAKLLAHKNDCVQRLREQIAYLLEQKGVTFLQGEATVLGDGLVQVESRGDEASEGDSAKTASEAAAEDVTDAKTQAEPKANTEGHTEGNMADQAPKVSLWRALRIVLATGGEPKPAEAVLGEVDSALLASPRLVTSDDLLDEEKAGLLLPDGSLPKQVAIVGAGIIGMEFASFFSDLGLIVHVFEYQDQILAQLDQDLGRALERILKRRGVKFLKSVEIQKAALEGETEQVQLTWQKRAKTARMAETAPKTKEEKASFDLVLVASGREPRGLSALDPKLLAAESRGFLLCDEHYESSIPGVYAIGDVRAGSRQLAHAAEAEARDLLALWLDLPRPLRMDVVPAVVYTDPELAACGHSEASAQAAGLAYKVAMIHTNSNGKSLIEGAERGFVKLLYDPEQLTLLGAALCCERAGELISEISQAMSRGASMADLAAVIRPHPSFSEMITQVTAEFLG